MHPNEDTHFTEDRVNYTQDCVHLRVSGKFKKLCKNSLLLDCYLLSI